MKHFAFYLLVSVGILTSCDSGRHASQPAPVVRLDSMIVSAATPDEVAALAADPVAAPALSLLDRLSADTGLPLPEYIESLRSGAAYRVFGPDVGSVFPDLRRQAALYASAVERSHGLMPGLDMPDTLFTVISPYRQSVILTPGRVFIALNHFLGSDYPGYEGFAEGVRRLSRPDRVAVAAVEAMLRSHSGPDYQSGMTLAGAMFHEGAVAYALACLMPDADHGVILGFTPDEMKWLRSNERSVWTEAVNRDILFSTDRNLHNRELGLLQSGYSSFGPDSPPRALRYIGWQMARSYAESNPGVSLSNLISTELAMTDDLLIRASYNP